MSDDTYAIPLGLEVKAEPFWRPFARRWQQRAARRHLDCVRRHQRVLEQMLGLHRDLHRIRLSHHEVEVALERVRNWNTSLLRDKDADQRAVAEARALLDVLRQRLDEAASAFARSQGEVQRLSNTLEATEASRDDLENDLKAALDREQALVVQIKDLRAQMRARRR